MLREVWSNYVRIEVIQTYLAKITIKNIKRAIIFSIEHIIYIIFHFHSNTVAFIIFTAFKFLITIFPCKPINSPLLWSSPFILAPCYYNWFIRQFVVWNKFSLGTFMFIYSLTIISERPVFVEIFGVSLLVPGFFSI